MRCGTVSFLKIIVLVTAGYAVSCFAEGNWIQVGPAYRGGMRVKSSRFGDPGTVGPQNQYADRTYDDGYVNIDPGTGNPAAINPNTTWFWGYDHAGQYNAAAETLSFHRSGRLNETMSGYGLEVVFGTPLIVPENRFGMDGCIGIQFLRASARTHDLTDVYDTTGIAIPAAGHQGTYDGPFDVPPAPGVLIPNLPDARIRSALKVDVDIFELWVGPKLYITTGEKLSLHLTPKVSANYVMVDVNRSGAFKRAGYTDGSKADFLFGAGVIGGADIEIGKGYFISLWGGYEWVHDTVDVSVSPGRVSVDVSGYTVGAAVGYRF